MLRIYFFFRSFDVSPYASTHLMIGLVEIQTELGLRFGLRRGWWQCLFVVVEICSQHLNELLNNVSVTRCTKSLVVVVSKGVSAATWLPKFQFPFLNFFFLWERVFFSFWFWE